MERNLRLYPAFQAADNLLFWLPVFFLYLQESVSGREVLQLEAIFYLAVVLLEVPSGYLSDRVGRRVTLIVSAAFRATGAIVFCLGGGFAAFALGQVGFAAGRAFKSGTDSALLYDSLVALDRTEEYADREARAHSVAFVALAVAAVLGGLVAAVDLRHAYVLSAASGLVTLALALQFVDPPGAGAAQGIGRQVVSVVGRLRDRALVWLLAVAVLEHVINHVPFEFSQVYLDLLFPPEDVRLAKVPLASGLLVGAMMGVSALASRFAPRLARRHGTARTLLGALALEVAIVVAMASVLHPAVLFAILLRNAPNAVVRPVLSAAVQPRLSSDVRATYLSAVSLCARLTFSLALAAAALAVDDAGKVDEPGLRVVLWSFVGAGLVGWGGLAATARVSTGRSRPGSS